MYLILSDFYSYISYRCVFA